MNSQTRSKNRTHMTAAYKKYISPTLKYGNWKCQVANGYSGIMERKWLSLLLYLDPGTYYFEFLVSSHHFIWDSSAHPISFFMSVYFTNLPGCLFNQVIIWTPLLSPFDFSQTLSLHAPVQAWYWNWQPQSSHFQLILSSFAPANLHFF